MITISAPVITSGNGKARISSTISDGASSAVLWFEVDQQNADVLSTENLDAFVVVCLLRAAKNGEQVAAEGAMSSKLHYNVNHLLGGILKEYFAAPRAVTVTARNLLSASGNRAPAVLSGFSGGVDSFCNYYEHSGDRASPDFRITHLIYNNVGSHGQKGAEKDFQTFESHAAAMKRFADEEGKPFIAVNSNLDQVVALNFQLTHTVRNAAVALLLQGVAGRFLYPSSYHVRSTKVALSHDMAALDPVILPVLGTERLDCISSGAQHDRTGKTVIVAAMPASRRFLDVCVEPAKAKAGKINCSVCWKCMRTQLTFDILGKLDLYGEVFDLAAYRRCKNLFLLDVLKSGDPFQRDLADLITAQGHRVGPRVKLAAALTPRFIAQRVGKSVVPRVYYSSRPLLALCGLVLGGA
jgi:hypothetical protein